MAKLTTSKGKPNHVARWELFIEPTNRKDRYLMYLYDKHSSRSVLSPKDMKPRRPAYIIEERLVFGIDKELAKYREKHADNMNTFSSKQVEHFVNRDTANLTFTKIREWT